MTDPLIQALGECEQLAGQLDDTRAELAIRTNERNAALDQVKLLERRVITLQNALQREVQTKREFVEKGIMVGIQEGKKLANKKGRAD